MRNIPVDTRSLSFLCVGESDVKADRDTGEVKVDREGRQLHTVDVVAMASPPDPLQRPEVIRVTTPLVKNAVPGQPLQVLGLQASPYLIEGKAGMAWKASEIRPAPQPQNGQAPTTGPELAKAAK